jgi:hypothetical protein
MRALVLIVAVIVGCGAEPFAPEPDYWTEGGIGIRVEPGAAEWASAADVGTRVDAIAQAVAEYSDRNVAIARGIVIVFRTGMVQCGDYPDGTPYVTTGCYRGAWIDITTDYPETPHGTGGAWLAWSTSNVEYTELAHELLHALIGDPDHISPLWSGVESIGRP